VTRLKQSIVIGFGIGALVPLFWGVLSMLLFNVPEGPFSRLFWQAVYVTCPSWEIDGRKAWVLMPLFNGCMYAGIAVLITAVFRRGDVRK
jgi:hypothetical protein